MIQKRAKNTKLTYGNIFKSDDTDQTTQKS